MSDIQDVVIIGAGISGLVSGYELSKKNKKVIVFEKFSASGGLIRPLSINNNYNIEGFYHHFFNNDDVQIKLFNELSLPITWKYTNTAFYFDDGIYEFSQPLNLIKFAPLSTGEKIKLVFFLTYLLKINDLTPYDNITAHEWLIKKLGKEIYIKFFKPLLWAKFNSEMDKISAAWLIGRLKMRGERSFQGEKLGYIKGGYIKFINALELKINEFGSKVYTNSEVIKIEKQENNLFKISVFYNNQVNVYLTRTVISTIHPVYLSGLIPFQGEYIKNAEQLKYQGAICVIFGAKNKLMDFYWMNIMKENINFGAIIEHTNFQPFSEYNEHIIYLASYPCDDSKLWKMNNSEVFSIYYEDLYSLFPEQCKNNKINWYNVIRTRNAGLIYRIGIKSLIPKSSTPIPGIFITGMFNCYPKRPINEIIKKANECVNEVMSYLSVIS